MRIASVAVLASLLAGPALAQDRRALSLKAAEIFAMAEYQTEKCNAPPLPIKTQNGLMELIIEGGDVSRQAYQTASRRLEAMEASGGRRSVCAAFADLDRTSQKARR